MNPAHLARRAGVAAAAVLAVALSACGGGDAPVDPLPPPLQPKGTFAVQSFEGPDACEALERHIEDTAEAMVREQLQSWLPGAAGGGAADTPATTGAPGQANAPEDASSASPTFSETNVREAGIDEADTVKTDGRRLFTLRRDAAGLTLSSLEITPPEAMRLLGQAAWPADETLAADARPVAPESPRGLMLAAPDVLLSLGTSEQFYAMPFPGGAGVQPDVATALLCADAGCGPGYPGWAPPRTRVRRFDVGADAAPVEQWLLDVPGSLLAARRIGSTLYLVTQSALRLPTGVRTWPDVPAGSSSGAAEMDARVAATMDENARLIRATSLDEWLADLVATERVGGPSATPQVLRGASPTAQQCASFARIDVASRLSWLQISSIDIDTREIVAQTVLAEGQGVYMSEHALIVFTSYWRQGDERLNPRDLSFLHRFVRDAQGRLAYQATAGIDGRLIDDYAIDEAGDGTIRYAATGWDGGNYSYVGTLQAAGGTLAALGSSEPIAPGETLQSARFIGDRAYLVTFRQIDPFFVYDLSDPAAPRRLGELKLPGFSTYLHPVDAEHLLGIGYDDGGWPRRLKATLFDVGDPASPRERLSVVLGDSYTDSDATWDRHAFAFHRPVPGAEPAYMAVPVRSYASSFYGTGSLSGIRVLRVAPSDGQAPLVLQGTLPMTDLLGDPRHYDGWRNGDARRAVFVGDSVYAIGDGAVRSAAIADPATPVDTVGIP